MEQPDASDERRPRPLLPWRRPWRPAVAAALVVFMLLLATIGAARWRSDVEDSENQDRLDTLTSETLTRVSASLERYADLLRSIGALESSAARTTSADFATFIAMIDPASAPGVKIVSYIEAVRPGDLAAHVAEERADRPDYAASPAQGAETHALVVHRWPDDASVLGVDLRSDPERATALDTAADLGMTSLLQPTTQVVGQRFEPNEIVALNAYLPVYEPGAPTSTVEERRAALEGWVGLQIDFELALQALALDEGLLDLTLQASGSPVIAESRPGAAETVSDASLVGESNLDLGVAKVSVRSAYRPGVVSNSTVPLIAVSGVIVALLAGWATYSSLRYRRSLVVQAESERARAELLASRFHAAIDDAPVGVVIADLTGRVEIVNDRLRELLGVPAETGEISILDHYLEEDAEAVGQSLATLLSGQVDHYVNDRQLRRTDGTRVWCRIHSALLRDPSGRPAGLVGHVQDIEAELASEEALRSQTRWFSAIVEQSHDLIVLIDADGVITWASPSIASLLEVEPGVLLGSSVLTLIHPDDRDSVLDAMERAKRGEPVHVEYRVKPSGDRWLWLETTGSSLLHDPDVNAIVTTSRDVTARHRTTEALAHKATHDPLTGLANRAELDVQLGAALESAAGSGAPVTVAFLDLDDFKDVNDEHGHAVGDALLRHVAETLQEELRDDDIISRLGGDEFVVAIVGSDVEAGRVIAERVRQRIAEPVSLGAEGTTISATASIGLAPAKRGADAATVIHAADVALYAAKRRGRNRVAVAGDQSTEEADQATLRGGAAGTGNGSSSAG